jgi:chitinase
LYKGTPGVLSYDEITGIIETNSLDVHYDETAGVKYFEWSYNQWASYDDVVTLKQKVDFANKQGLLGLFIWAIDLDSLNHDALNAVLYPEGLGAFKDRNGVGTFGTSDYGTAAVTSCALGGMTSKWSP